MASETVVSDHSTSSEQVEKEVHEGVKTIEQESVPPPKESGEDERPKAEDLTNPAVPMAGLEEKIEDKQVEPPVIEEVKKTDNEEKPKAEDSPSPEAPLAESEEKIKEKQIEPPLIEEVKKTDEEEKLKAESSPSPEAPLAESEEKIKDKQIEEVKKTDEEEKPKAESSPSPEAPLAESEEKIKDKQIEPPLIEEVKKTDEEEHPKADSPSPAVPLAESEEKIEDGQIEPPVIKEVKKTNDASIVDVSVEDTLKVAKETIPEPDTRSVSEPVADNIKSQAEEQRVIESAEKPQEGFVMEFVEEKPEEHPKIVNVLESSVEAVEKKEEQVEDLPVKESEAALVKDLEISELESKKEEIPGPVPDVEEKPQEQSEVTEQIEKGSAVVEPKESLEVEIAKNEESTADKVEDIKLWKEEETTKDDPLVTESLDQVTSTNEKAPVDQKGDGGEIPPADVAEMASMEDKENELGGEADVVEGFSKEEAAESGQVEAENGAKNVKTEEENGEKNVTTEELTQPEMKKVEDVTSSISTTEVLEKPLEGENTSRDIELVAENGKKEDIKDETVASVETNKNGDVEGKVDEVTTTTAKEPVEEPQKPEPEVEGEETVQTGETKLEKEKEVDETAKPDVHNPESTKDGNDTKTSQDPPKEEVSAKSTQKQSNNIIAKVKHSLVKAKKAIIGKSPNSKTPSSETKGEVKVK